MLYTSSESVGEMDALMNAGRTLLDPVFYFLVMLRFLVGFQDILLKILSSVGKHRCKQIWTLEKVLNYSYT